MYEEKEMEDIVDLEIEEISISKETEEDIATGIAIGKELIPSINIEVPNGEHKDLIADKDLLGIYNEALTNIRNDRKEIDELLANFINSITNDGDATTSSKEAVVNLIKIKTDTTDKISKIADLMTRIKLKETNTFPKYLAAHQNNTINVGEKVALTSAQKRALIERENKNNKDLI